MNVFRITPYYIVWHYTDGIKSLILTWRNFLWFIPSFFSIKILLKTLFNPFERLSENYKRGGIDIESFLSTLVINILMRIVGIIIRLMMIMLGIFTYLFTFFIGILALIGWCLLPLLLVFLLALSFKAFFNTL